MRSFVIMRKSENICVFPIFLAIGFIWGINGGETLLFPFTFLSLLIWIYQGTDVKAKETASRRFLEF